MRRLRLSAVVTAAVLAGPLSAEDTWTELRAPHVRVVTNASVEQARAVALDFERMRITLGWRMPGISLDLNGPLTVYVTRDDASFLRLHPKWEDPELFDFYGNWERNIAFVNISNWSKVEQHPAFLGYVHELVRQDSWPLPTWLDRGLTQLLGSVRFEGKVTIVGAPTQRWVSLKSQPILPIARVIQDQPLLGFLSGEVERARQQQVNEAWGLVHFLTFGPHMQSGALLLSLYRRLQLGDDPIASFQAIFGDLTQLDAAFLAYIHDKALGGAAAEVPPVDLTNAPTRTLTSTQMQDELGQIMVSTRDVTNGRRAFERSLQTDPQDGAAYEELGIIDYDSGHLDQAREHWKSAVAADKNRYVARIALIMTGTPFRTQTPEQRTATLYELQQIERIALSFSPVFVQVALLQWWMGDLPAALQACAEAERLSPARSDYHLLHAKLLVAQGQPRVAAAIMRRQIEAFHAENQGMAFENVLLWQSLASGDRDTNSPLPASIPQGRKIVLGRIKSVECIDHAGGFHFSVTIQAADGSGILKLASDRPLPFFSDTTWIGGGHNPVCYASKGQPAYAIYKSGSKEPGELDQFEILEDTPAVAAP
jgi:tetratricopeptide (TPR) repeat protein